MAKEKSDDAIALLKADHRTVEGLFKKYEKARGSERKDALAKKICMELTIHTLLEEGVFYPACRGQIEDDTLDEAYVEHDGAKMLIAELIAGSPQDDFYDAKVKVLSEEIKHHVKEEEQRGGLFAQARKEGLDLMELGAKMAARKKELKAKISESGIPEQKTRTMHGGKVKHGSPTA